MKIFYGYDDQHYINVTSVIFDRCFEEDELLIPPGDGKRCEIIGFDPYPNVLKHILIVDYRKNKYRFNNNEECRLSFKSIIAQLEKGYNPRQWWREVGKNITDWNERVSELHKQLKFEHGTLDDELPEQLLASQFIKPDAKVLELGGNLGRNSLVISTIINDPRQHVVLECNSETAALLKHNLELNGYATQVEPSALSYTKLIQKDWSTMPASDRTDKHQDWTEVSTITFEELEKKYNIPFDTLVADCEGSLYFILKDNPSMLDSIQLIIMENDYNDIDQKRMVDAILYLKGFSRAYHMAGGWGPCYDFFYEVWKK
jgi:FkbM family methyltransferase